jgi:hypothetical protein
MDKIVTVDKPNKCYRECCGHTWCRKYDYLRHIKSEKHVKMCEIIESFSQKTDIATPITQCENKKKIETRYICNCCQFSATKNKEFKKHQKSKQHTSNENMSSDSLNKLFACLSCNETYDKYKSCWEHMKRCETKKNNIIIETPKNEHLLSLSSFKNIETRYFCDFCQFSTTNKKVANKHRTSDNVEDLHVIIKRFICTTCAKPYKNYKSCWEHSNKCHGKNEQEIVENIVTENTVSTVKKHEDKNIEINYHCEVCDYDTSKKMRFNIHCMTVKHAKMKSYWEHVRKHEDIKNNIVTENPTEICLLIKKEKPIRKTIPLALKRIVWNKYIGEEIGKTTCLCCKLTDISQMSFSCGHIISDYNGGGINIENLKPICSSCNSSMGTQNMDEFIQIYGF